MWGVYVACIALPGPPAPTLRAQLIYVPHLGSADSPRPLAYKQSGKTCQDSIRVGLGQVKWQSPEGDECLREQSLCVWEGRKKTWPSQWKRWEALTHVKKKKKCLVSPPLAKMPLKCWMWSENVSSLNALVNTTLAWSRIYICNQIKYSIQEGLKWAITLYGLPKLPSIFSTKLIQILHLEVSTSMNTLRLYW